MKIVRKDIYELSDDFKSSLRHFVYYYTNGTLEYVVSDKTLLKDIDYREILKAEASMVEQAFAIYANNIEMDNNGVVLNQSHSMTRAAQWIRWACNVEGEKYKVDPPFEAWETELH